MTVRSAVIVVIDRLQPTMLGPYGNTWLETPAWNRLASESLLIETALTDVVDLQSVYYSYWQGIPSWLQGKDSTSAHLPSLPEIAREQGCRCVLITDDAEIATHPLADRWEEIIQLPAAECISQPSADQTSFARLFQEACGWVAQAEGPFLVWLHSRGMSGPWDAPYELRSKLADLDDPAPPTGIPPPEIRLPPDADPDIALGHGQAYAAQVLVLDVCLGAFFEVLRSLPHGNDALWSVTAPRGYPLGEHLRIGPCDNALYAELLQVPLAVRLPDATGAAARSQQFAQPFDVFEMLTHWLPGLADSNEVAAPAFEPVAHLLRLAAGLDSSRQVAVSVHASQQALRTPAWFFRRENSETSPVIEIFAKPDDRYEVNEVGDRCQDVVPLLLERLHSITTAQASLIDELPAELQ